MKTIMRRLRVLLALLATGGIVQAQFVAFNDHYQGPNSSPDDIFWNVFGTLGGAPSNSGPLKNITDGTNVGGSLTITNINVTCVATSAPVQLTVGPDLTPPTVASIAPLAGSFVRELNSIEVDFSMPVTGVDAWDLLVNGLPATNLVILTPSQFLFEFARPSTGTVQMAWAPNHGIHDLSAAGNAFAGGSWTYAFLPNLPVLGSLYITEFMAANKSFLRDQDGDYSDWIELYNNTAVPINLAGYGLSDDPNDLLKWQFPSLMLPARSYMYLFASGKNRTNALGRLHTNFQLNKGGGYLALSYPPAYVMDSCGLSYPPQTADVSYGRARGDLTSVGFFSVPTPGAPNSTSGAGFGPAVVFSRAPGT